MCLIIAQPSSVSAVESDIIARAWNANHDGAGYMYADRGILKIRKPFFKLKELQRAYSLDHKQFGETSPFVIHFRWATHGKKDETNTHPHLLDCGLGMVHNGVLPVHVPHGNNISDTVAFCRSTLAKRDPSQIMSEDFGNWLEDQIGWNKLVFMNSSGEVKIINSSAGTWRDSTWYSNLTWEQPSYAWESEYPLVLPKSYRQKKKERQSSVIRSGDVMRGISFEKGSYYSQDAWNKLDEDEEFFKDWQECGDDAEKLAAMLRERGLTRTVQ